MAETQEPPKIHAHAEEALVAMAARAAADGDEFRVKVIRRASPSSPHESIAIIDGANVEQIANPEGWLSRLAGGSGQGSYMFRVVHAKDKLTDRPIGFYQITAIPSQPKVPDTKADQDPTWPRNLALTYVAGEQKNGTPKTPNLGGPSDPLTTGAPRQPPVEGRDGGAALFAALTEERRRLDEDRHRAELDLVRRASEDDRKRFEQKMQDALDRLQRENTQPKQTLEELLMKVATVAVPILTPVLAMMTEMRKSRDARDAADRERQDRREEQRVDRETKLLEKIAAGGAEQAKMIGVFTESLSTVARGMVQTVAMVQELRTEPQEEGGVIGLVKEAIRAWGESQRFAPQPALPPQPQPRPPPQPAAAQPTAEPPGEEVDMPAAEVLDQLAKAVEGHEEVEGLAADIVDGIASAEFVGQVQSEGGAISALQRRLGDAWGNDQGNSQYVRDLFTAVARIAASKNIDARVLFVARPPAQG